MSTRRLRGWLWCLPLLVAGELARAASIAPGDEALLPALLETDRRIEFAPGDYAIGPLLLPPGTEFEGIRGEVTIRPAGTARGAAWIEGTGALRISGIAFEGSGGGGVLVREAGTVAISGCAFRGQWAAPALHVIGAGSDGVTSSTLTIEDVSIRGGRQRLSPLGLITIVEPEAFARITLAAVNLEASGGTGLRVVSRRLEAPRGVPQVVMTDCRFAGWERGAVLDTLGAARVTMTAEGANSFEGCVTGLQAGGAGVTIEPAKGALRFKRNRTGLLLTGGASARLDGATFDANHGVGIECAGSVLSLRGCEFRNNALCVLIQPGEAMIDLGTQADPGGNRFDVAGAAFFAVRNESGKEVPAFGNHWSQSGNEYHGHVAVDDLIDDGDADNPLSEHGSGPVLLERRDDTPKSTLRWDIAGSRMTPGYGFEVFRSREEIELRLPYVQALELSAGVYPMIPFLSPDQTITGAGSSRSILEPTGTEEGALLRPDLDALTLKALSLRARGEGANPARGLEWSGGALTLEDVAIEGFSAEGLLAHPGGQRVELRGVRVLRRGAGGADAAAAVRIRGRDVKVAGLEVQTSGGGAALDFASTDSLRMLHGTDVSLRCEGASRTPALSLQGHAELKGLRIVQEEGTGVLLRAADYPARVSLEDVYARGFTDAGIRIADGVFGTIHVSGAELNGTARLDKRACGLRLMETATASLELDRVTGFAVRPGIEILGTVPSLHLNRVQLVLATLFNSLPENESGVLLSARKGCESAPLVTACRFEGYDDAFRVTSLHDDGTTITFGDYTGEGANHFLRNVNGLLLESGKAVVEVREDRNLNEFEENGVALRVKAGRLRLEGARVLRNSVGVLVEGGEVDLGGGALGSRGGNVLWPQAGPFAVQNMTAGTVWAVGNDWGAAQALLGTEAAPIRDQRTDAKAGLVVTRIGGE
ncbi:right-handed parallel beta-helix repeat-containing protein [Candidatus Poribacteria bacterium]|nr:right-handed parallel beta-helix repeat-containing protein [Candidatus Poribacteria bacterium]